MRELSITSLPPRIFTPFVFSVAFVIVTSPPMNDSVEPGAAVRVLPWNSIGPAFAGRKPKADGGALVSVASSGPGAALKRVPSLSAM